MILNCGRLNKNLIILLATQYSLCLRPRQEQDIPTLFISYTFLSWDLGHSEIDLITAAYLSFAPIRTHQATIWPLPSLR